MKMRRIGLAEIMAAVGGALLGLSLFATWYDANPKNPNANINKMTGGVTGWDSHTILRYVWLAAALAPILLAYIILRDHELSWPRGELTAVVGIAAFGLLAYQGVIDRPGEPPSEISLGYGWFVGLVGTLLIATGGALRASGTERPRKPPGVL